jgi:trehalose 6-phosphate phosphatase
MDEIGNQAPPLLDNLWLEQLQDRLSAASGLLLCLDFDGTLAPIVENPDDAALAVGNRRLLEHLGEDPDVTVAVVSGRSIADLRKRVGVDGLYYAGNHGLEWDDGSGTAIAAEVRETQAALQDMLARLRSCLSDIDGCPIEDKSLTATVHYRQVSNEQLSTVVEATRAIVRTTDEFECRSGKEILEIRPDIPGGKDRIVDRLRDQYPNAVPLFVGDDITDEDGFRAVGADGHGILVGDRKETAASVRVPDPDGVTMLLAWIVDRSAKSPALSSTT